MIRLQASITMGRSAIILFQFLYDTITSLMGQVLQGLQVYFNSSMIRLQDSSVPTLAAFISYFNSSMIRLQEVPPLQQQQTLYLFQFLYDTITSVVTNPDVNVDDSFQFLYDTITRFVEKPNKEWVQLFQFLYDTITRKMYIPVQTE